MRVVYFGQLLVTYLALCYARKIWQKQKDRSEQVTYSRLESKSSLGHGSLTCKLRLGCQNLLQNTSSFLYKPKIWAKNNLQE